MINIRKPWKRILNYAEIKDVRLHDLRHTFASIAVGQGAPLPIIGKQLGHKSNITTNRYAHLARDPVRKVAETTAQHIHQVLNNNGK